jgi:hypothetical protein
MLDRELTGLEWRVLLWVSLHDGMSLVRGKGPGCYASNKTLFAEVGCHYSAGCRALSRLEERGHLVRERLGRSTRYRVVFADPNSLQAGNISAPAMGDEPASDEAEIGCDGKSEPPEIVYETPRDYIPLSGELDSVETGGLNSTKWRDSCFSEKDGAEAQLGRVSLKARLPKNFDALDSGAQVARIERAFKAIGSDADKIDRDERGEIWELLWAIGDAFAGEPIGFQAQRLCDEIAVF